MPDKSLQNTFKSLLLGLLGGYLLRLNQERAGRKHHKAQLQTALRHLVRVFTTPVTDAGDDHARRKE